MKLFEPLLKTGLLLMKNVLKPLDKSLGLTAAASATDAAIHKKIFGSGITTLIISSEEINDIMKIVKSLEVSGLLIKGVSETIKNEAKEEKGGFLSMLLGKVRQIQTCCDSRVLKFFFSFSPLDHINVTRICAKFEGSTSSGCRIMAIYVFFRIGGFLFIWRLKHF